MNTILSKAVMTDDKTVQTELLIRRNTYETYDGLSNVFGNPTKTGHFYDIGSLLSYEYKRLLTNPAQIF
jgi:hypothetical protein